MSPGSSPTLVVKYGSTLLWLIGSVLFSQKIFHHLIKNEHSHHIMVEDENYDENSSYTHYYYYYYYYYYYHYQYYYHHHHYHHHLRQRLLSLIKMCPFPSKAASG